MKKVSERKVTTIPASICKSAEVYCTKGTKRRVAGYARVSTDHDEQLTSYQAQVDYYTGYIKSRDDWEFVGMYTDEGISATNTRRREGFKAMIADAKAGKIDLIITKSVSRFARNTVDSLTTVRELKNLGIEIYFEKENIWTLDSKGELLITIMSSLAQEESRSISENVTWGHRKRFADGKAMLPFSNVLGFERGEDGQILVNKDQALIVKMIFRMFLEGMTPYSIAKELTRKGIKSPMGKDKWYEKTIYRMLSNEKYKGDALLQKAFTVDFLQKRLKKNEGEVPQYYVEGNHEAIIDPQVFDIVQEELQRRKHDRQSKYSGVSIYSSKIKCACCGGWYGAKVWHSNDKYRKVIYQCNRKYDSAKCDTPHITEDEVQKMFIHALNQLISDRDEIIENLRIVNQTLNNTDEVMAKKNNLRSEIEKIVEIIDSYIMGNALTVSNQDDYQQKYREMVSRYESLMKEYDDIKSAIKTKKARFERISLFIRELKKHDKVIGEFDTALWNSMLDHIIIDKKEGTVVFKDGTTIKVSIK